MNQAHKIYVVSAPSGTGKTTLNRRLLDRHSDRIAMSISYTARPIRKVETNGVDYHFVSPEAFQEKISEGAMLEYAKVFGIFYGTAIDEITRIHNTGKDALLEIDTQGWEQAKQKISNHEAIFILPPSFESLWQRLKSRGTEPRETQIRRLLAAKAEISCAHTYDHFIVNEDIDQAYQNLEDIVIKGHNSPLSAEDGRQFCANLLTEYENSPLLQSLSAESTDKV